MIGKKRIGNAVLAIDDMYMFQGEKLHAAQNILEADATYLASMSEDDLIDAMRRAYNNASNAWQGMRAALAVVRQRDAAAKCVWEETPDEPWRGECGVEWSSEGGETPSECGVKFCENCGKRVEVIATEEGK